MTAAAAAQVRWQQLVAQGEAGVWAVGRTGMKRGIFFQTMNGR